MLLQRLHFMPFHILIRYQSNFFDLLFQYMLVKPRNLRYYLIWCMRLHFWIFNV